MKGKIIPENSYREVMEGKVADFVKEHIRHSRLKSTDGTKIHALYALHPDPKGAVLIIHGLSEFAERYLEQIYYFYNEGYSVFAPDLRGHGRSGRKIREENRIFVMDFREYTEDIHCVILQLLKEKCPDVPVLIYAHSMGGGIAALYLEEYAHEASAAILSSPMLGIFFKDNSEKGARVLAKLSGILNWNNKTIGKDRFDSDPSFEESCSLSKPRFDYTLEKRNRYRAYRTENITYAWVRAALKATDLLMKNAEKIDIPILICQAGDDTLVDNDSHMNFALRTKKTEIVRFPSAKHEIANSGDDIISLYWDTVFDFYNKILKAGS